LMRWRASRRQHDPYRAVGFATPRYIARDRSLHVFA
jgi:hypothetical protein